MASRGLRWAPQCVRLSDHSGSSVGGAPCRPCRAHTCVCCAACASALAGQAEQQHHLSCFLCVLRIVEGACACPQAAHTSAERSPTDVDKSNRVGDKCTMVKTAVGCSPALRRVILGSALLSVCARPRFSSPAHKTPPASDATQRTTHVVMHAYAVAPFRRPSVLAACTRSHLRIQHL
jgi:hypothetical protein